MRTKGTDTQYLYVKVRAEVRTQVSHTLDLYLMVRGEMGDSVQTLRTSIQTSEGRWETVYTHSAPLSKGQRGFGTTVYRHSGPLSKGQRGGGRHYTDTQDLSVNI